MPVGVIELKCIPKQRPRFDGQHAYMSARYKAHKADFQVLLKSVFKIRKTALFPAPQAVSLSIVVAFKAKGAGDIDNLAGFVMDAANGLLYDDDRQVKRLRVQIEPQFGRDMVTIEIVKETK